MMMYELLPCNNQKSFYGKAKVYVHKQIGYYLKSYDTVVCSIKYNGDFVRYWPGYSSTTMKHINSFRKQFNLKPLTKKDYEKMPVSSLTNILQFN